jgi:hypothetical protein
MTPARRKLLTDAIDLIRAASNAETFDAVAIRDALIGMGARFFDVHHHAMHLGGVTARCAWYNGEHLLTRWAANARTTLEQDDGNG